MATSIFDHWEVAVVVLSVLLLICNWGVWKGVKLEESFDSWEKETGKRLLEKSLAWEVAIWIAIAACHSRRKYKG
jgi:hypothetical protein